MGPPKYAPPPLQMVIRTATQSFQHDGHNQGPFFRGKFRLIPRRTFSNLTLEVRILVTFPRRSNEKISYISWRNIATFLYILRGTVASKCLWGDDTAVQNGLVLLFRVNHSVKQISCHLGMHKINSQHSTMP